MMKSGGSGTIASPSLRGAKQRGNPVLFIGMTIWSFTQNTHFFLPGLTVALLANLLMIAEKNARS